MTTIVLSKKEISTTWIELLACARTLALFFQTAHWMSKGNNSYGDHLLFERIYNDILPEIDSIGERAITNAEDNVSVSKTLDGMLNVFGQAKNAESGSVIDQAVFLQKKFIVKLDEMNQYQLTQGTRNLINGISDKHEEHLYLLTQRAK